MLLLATGASVQIGLLDDRVVAPAALAAVVLDDSGSYLFRRNGGSMLMWIKGSSLPVAGRARLRALGLATLLTWFW